MSASIHDVRAEAMVLNLAYDAGGSIPFDALRREIAGALPVKSVGRLIWRAVYTQHNLGNIMRHRGNDPIVLTPSARFAIAAGRMAAA